METLRRRALLTMMTKLIENNSVSSIQNYSENYVSTIDTIFATPRSWFYALQVSDWAIVLTSCCPCRVAVGKLNNCAANRVMNILFTDLFRNHMLLFEYLMFMFSSTV